MVGSLHVAVHTVGSAVVVSAAGEIDGDTVHEVQAPVLAACMDAVPGGLLVVDLTHVRYLGSVGISMLVRARQRCVRRGVALRTVAGTVIVRRALDVAGVTAVFSVTDSLDEALAGHDPDPARGH